MRLGLEAEYWVIDEEGALCDGRDLLEVHDQISPEFIGSLIEIKTSPMESVSELRDEFIDVLNVLLSAASANGQHLVPLGTPLSPQSLPINTTRGNLLERIYGDGIEPAKNCAGTHIHFERDRVTRQLNLLTALDPALALVSSSPYYHGERLANCARAHVYRHESGVQFERYRDLWEYTTEVSEWERRIDARHHELRTIALEAGISNEKFAAHFEPENVVMTPVRLRGVQPTVEWRAPDTALPSQIFALIETVADLVERTTDTSVTTGEPAVNDQQITVPPFAELRELTDAAVEKGLHSPMVREYLTTMGFDQANYDPRTDVISDSRQLDETAAKQIRIDTSKALEADVAALA